MIIDLFLNLNFAHKPNDGVALVHLVAVFFKVCEIVGLWKTNKKPIKDGFFCPPQAENFVWIFFKLKSGDRENMKIIPPYLKGMGG